MPKNSLNIGLNACSHWDLSDGIRELLQNTIDGAVEYILYSGIGNQRSDIRPIGKGWYIKKCAPSSMAKEIGFTHGGEAEMILSLHRDNDIWIKPKNLKDWHEDQKSIAYIKIKYASQDEIDWNPFKLNGKHPPNAVITEFEAANRLTPKFSMECLTLVGESGKENNVQQAGKFGDGFCSSAAVVVRNGYSLVVATNKTRRNFIFKDRTLCYEQQDSRLTEAMRKKPDIIYVTLKLSQYRCGNHEFNPCVFRLIYPGIPFATKGGVLTKEDYRGWLYCMGIRVCNKDHFLFGYDIPYKAAISGRDRNDLNDKWLDRCILPLLKDEVVKDENFLLLLLEKILACSSEGSVKCHEIIAILNDEYVCQRLAECFKKERGNILYPCKSDEVKRIDEYFKKRQLLLLPDNVVKIFRLGRYRSPEEELDFFFSDYNIVNVDENGEMLVKSALARLARIEGCKITRENLKFINGDMLKQENRCKLKDDIFYVNNAMLLLAKKMEFIRASNLLGHRIAVEVKDPYDFSLLYSEFNDSTSSWYKVEWGDNETQIQVCQRLFDETKEILVREKGLDEFSVIKLEGLCTKLCMVFIPGAEYTFSFMNVEGCNIIDPLSQKACILTKKIVQFHANVNNSIEETIHLEYCEKGGIIDNNFLENGNLFDYNDDSYPEEAVFDDSAEECLSQNELMSIFGSSYDIEEDEAISDISDDEPEEKRHKSVLPKDEVIFNFGEVTLCRGEVYQHGHQIIKILMFTGKRWPPSGAICEIVSTLKVAILNTAAFGGCSVKTLSDTVAKQLVHQKVHKRSTFLNNLSKYNGSDTFDEIVDRAYFELKVRDEKKSDFFVELSRRKLDLARQSTFSAKPHELVLFAGVGGSSIGSEKAGTDVSWLVEKDPLRAASLQGSHPQAKIFPESVESFLNNCVNKKPGYPSRGEVDTISSSSPCKGLSTANRGGRNDMANNKLSFEIIRALEILQPPTGYQENVPGMLRGPNLKFSGELMLSVVEWGYQVRVSVHNACTFGDPQNRQRVILSFSRGDTPLPDMPQPTHLKNNYVTLGQALQGLSIHCDESEAGFCVLPCGTLSYNHIASKPSRDIYPLCEHKPVFTITTRNTSGFVHPCNPNRTLSVRELARLFSFPDSKQFFGSITAMRAQIGDAVPVMMAKAISLPIVAVHRKCAGANEKNA